MISPFASSMLALALGCFCRAAAMTLRIKEVKVRRAPFLSYAAAYFLRTDRRSVISASSNWFIFGMVVQDSTIRRLTVRLNGDIDSRRMGPHLEKSIVSPWAP